MQKKNITVWWHIIEQQENRKITSQIAWEKFYLDADRTASLPPADISAKLCPSEDSRVKDFTEAPEGTTWKPDLASILPIWLQALNKGV